MINGATSFLTLLSVLVHAGFGCCAHHAHGTASHAEPASIDARATLSTSDCTCRFHAHDHSDAANTDEQRTDRKPDHESCPCDESSEHCTDHCSWLTGSRVELPDGHEIALPTAMADSCLRHAADSILTGWWTEGAPELSWSADSLRATTQVWQL
ncbi:MAG: hypothetical protein RIK87_28945 [Fuerstiella sp.]